MSSDVSFTDQELAKVFPDLAVRWRRVAEDMWNNHQKRIRVIEGLRTFARQWELYGQGRKKEKNGLWLVTDKSKIVTNAVPGLSMHQYGLAIDSGFVGPDPYLEKLPKAEAKFLWKEYGRFVMAHGMEWGGDWNGNGKEDRNDWDRPHCQLRYGLSISAIQSLHDFNGVKAVWAKCKALVQCGQAYK